MSARRWTSSVDKPPPSLALAKRRSSSADRPLITSKISRSVMVACLPSCRPGRDPEAGIGSGHEPRYCPHARDGGSAPVADRTPRRIDAHQHIWDLATGAYGWPTAAEG